jgi:hypothetical protein
LSASAREGDANKAKARGHDWAVIPRASPSEVVTGSREGDANKAKARGHDWAVIRAYERATLSGGIKGLR